MPETSVDKNRFPAFSKDDIRAAGKIARMKSVSKSGSVE
jgi:hypothetical protein